MVAGNHLKVSKKPNGLNSTVQIWPPPLNLLMSNNLKCSDELIPLNKLLPFSPDPSRNQQGNLPQSRITVYRLHLLHPRPQQPREKPTGCGPWIYINMNSQNQYKYFNRNIESKLYQISRFFKMISLWGIPGPEPMRRNFHMREFLRALILFLNPGKACVEISILTPLICIKRYRRGRPGASAHKTPI